MKEMIGSYDVKDEEGNVVTHNKFKNCFTERFLHNKRSCRWSSHHETYMSDVLTKDPELYRYARGNQGFAPLSQEGVRGLYAWTVNYKAYTDEL